jgi:hypothetical protein
LKSKEANETLSKQKRKEFNKDNRPSPERVKLFTKTADLEDQTRRSFSSKLVIHYHISKDELNKDNV